MRGADVIGSSSWLCGDWHFRLLSLAKSSRISSVDAVLVIPALIFTGLWMARTSDEISEFISA